MLTPRDIEQVAALLGALDSELRLKILLLLDEGEYVVHQLVAELGKSQPLISQHLRVLKAAGLVDSRRAGREVIYSLAEPGVIDVIGQLAALKGLKGGDELARRRQEKSSISAAAIIEPPADVRPAVDPGVIPQTPKPRRD